MRCFVKLLVMILCLNVLSAQWYFNTARAVERKMIFLTNEMGAITQQYEEIYNAFWKLNYVQRHEVKAILEGMRNQLVWENEDVSNLKLKSDLFYKKIEENLRIRPSLRTEVLKRLQTISTYLNRVTVVEQVKVAAKLPTENLIKVATVKPKENILSKKQEVKKEVNAYTSRKFKSVLIMLLLLVAFGIMVHKLYLQARRLKQQGLDQLALEQKSLEDAKQLSAKIEYYQNLVNGYHYSGLVIISIDSEVEYLSPVMKEWFGDSLQIGGSWDAFVTNNFMKEKALVNICGQFKYLKDLRWDYFLKSTFCPTTQKRICEVVRYESYALTQVGAARNNWIGKNSINVLNLLEEIIAHEENFSTQRLINFPRYETASDISIALEKNKASALFKKIIRLISMIQFYKNNTTSADIMIKRENEKYLCEFQIKNVNLATTDFEETIILKGQKNSIGQVLKEIEHACLPTKVTLFVKNIKNNDQKELVVLVNVSDFEQYGCVIKSTQIVGHV